MKIILLIIFAPFIVPLFLLYLAVAAVFSFLAYVEGLIWDDVKRRKGLQNDPD